MPRKVLVLGATGGTGREVVSQALAQGHDVTALVRDPGRLPVRSDRLRVLVGSVIDGDGPLAVATQGRDVVISALGVGKSLKSSGLIAHSAPAIVRAMESNGVRRLIFTSAYGVGATWTDVPAVPRILMRLLFRDLYTDKAAGEEHMTDGPHTGRYRVGERLTLHGFPRIPRADVADFLLALMDDHTYVRRGVLISS